MLDGIADAPAADRHYTRGTLAFGEMSKRVE
jgi:hypothetical protein